MNAQKTEKFMVRMDKKLLAQLVRYANSRDIPRSQAAREAIRKFCEEQEQLDKTK